MVTENTELQRPEKISVANLKNAISPSDLGSDYEPPVENDYKVRNKESEFVKREIHNDGLRDYYKLRMQWSIFLMVTLAVLTSFQCVLVVLIGLKSLDFAKYQIFLRIQAVEYFGQIVGMCLIVVKFLFPGFSNGHKENVKSRIPEKTPSKQRSAVDHR